MIYISKFRKDIKPLKIKFRKTIRNGARIYTPEGGGVLKPFLGKFQK